MRFDPASKLVRNRRYVDYLEGKPISPQLVEISLTGRCDAGCPWCFYNELDGKDGKDIMSEMLEVNLLRMKSMGVEAINWTGGGEPTLHPDFEKFVVMAYGLGIKQGLFTNALKDPNYPIELFDWIRVSKTNKPFNLDALRKLRENARGGLGITVNYQGDERELLRTLDVASRVKLDYVQVRPALHLKGVTTSIPAPMLHHPLLQIADYKFHEASRKRGYTFCEGYHFVPFIWQDGEVNACAYQKGNDRYVLGNLHDKPFDEIMKSVPQSIGVDDQCQICCKNHEINQTIARARTLEDVAFL